MGVSAPTRTHSDHIEENAMHPTISYQLAQARIADVHQDAKRAALARAARTARPDQPRHPAPLWSALGRVLRPSPTHRAVRAERAAPGAAASALTPRELDVLKLIAQGLTNPDIARRLVLSEHTVHRHLANILHKLGLPSRAAAAAWGVRAGVV
jgi:DNA-binding NarL/FixJ family response regulator